MTKAVLIAFILSAVFIEGGNFQTENPSERLNRFSDDSGYQPGGPSGGQGRGASGTITDGYPDSNSPPVRRYPSRNYAETSSVKSGPPDRDYNVRPSPDQNQRSRNSQQRSQDIRGQQVWPSMLFLVRRIIGLPGGQSDRPLRYIIGHTGNSERVRTLK